MSDDLTQPQPQPKKNQIEDVLDLVDRSTYGLDELSELSVETPGVVADLVEQVVSAAGDVAEAISAIDL